MPPLKARPVLDEAFIPPPPAYDSPQRPGLWAITRQRFGGEPM
ncbi:hypothetical protein [Deinococcus murrayi]|nr:hypothetical protein [Deinococcus murrayi]